MKHLDKTEEKATKKIKEFLVDSNEDAIHDLRVSIRKIDSVLRILPKNVRSRNKVSNYRSRYKELFKLNSELRDIDIISSKLKAYPARLTLDQGYMLDERLKALRSEKLKEARDRALLTIGLRALEIDENEISDKKIYRRFHKIICRYAERIEKGLPSVVSDEGKIKELHKLRKDCKKLRYTLNLLDSQTKQNRNTVSLREYLENLQDTLGSIHDCDIMIQYLKATYTAFVESGGDIANFHSMVQLEQKKRQSLYHAFLDLHGEGENTKTNLAIPQHIGRSMIHEAAAR
jgi:CHAD domain-containing protein